MYSNYAKLQQLQLPKQPYYETQNTYLLVYAPGRSRALENTLDFQLHRKFRLVSELGAALTPSVAGHRVSEHHPLLLCPGFAGGIRLRRL